MYFHLRRSAWSRTSTQSTIYRNFLPHASEGWERGNIFSLSVSSHVGGTPSSWWGGTPLSRSGWGVTPSSWWGYHPLPRSGRGGYPIQLMGGTPFPGLDGWGIPPGKGVSPWQGYPPQKTSTACTWYTAGGMPLAFTQEDFLVSFSMDITWNLNLWQLPGWTSGYFYMWNIQYQSTPPAELNVDLIGYFTHLVPRVFSRAKPDNLMFL